MLYQALTWLLLVTFTTASECHDYVLISTRGSLEPQGPSVGFVGMINTTLKTIPNGIEYDTIYPASSDLAGAVPGIAHVIKYITDGVKSCPEQVYGLLGYSQGASVNNIALHNFTEQSAEYKAIMAVVVIGNPGHVEGASANFDEYGGSTTRNLNGSYYLGGTGAIPDPFYSDDKVLDICSQGDVVCVFPPNGTFSIEPAHLIYGSTPKVQEMGAEFLIRKLRGSACPAPPARSSASASGSASLPKSTTKSASASAPTAPAATFTGMAASSLPVNSGLIFGLAAMLMAV